MNTLSERQMMIFEKDALDCKDVCSLLSDLIDQELPLSLKSRVESHLRTCPICHEMHAQLELTVHLAKELRDPPMPQGVQLRLRRALNQRLGLNLPLVDDSTSSN